MMALRRIVDAIDNRMNPVTIKELRQAVRSGLVTGGFLLFVLALLLTMGGTLLSQGAVTVDFQGGPEIFAWLMVILTVAATCLLPMYACGRLARERADPHAGLLFSTTLSTWRIVWGKTLASAVLAVIVYSACAPFITFTYLLRGIDFPTIFLVLAMSFLFTATVIQFAIFIGALPVGRFIRIILALIGLWLVWSAIGSFMFAFMYGAGFLMFGGGVGGWTGLWEAWPGLLSFLILDMLFIGLFYVLTVTLLIPPAANRTLVLRLYVIFTWLATGVMALLWAIKEQHGAPMLMWGTLWWAFFILSMLFAIGERESWGPRIRRRIPRNGLLRAGAFVLYTGSAGGVIWILLMIAATAVAMEITRSLCSSFSGGWRDLDDMMLVLSGLTLFGYAYCITAVLLRPRVLKRLPARHLWFMVLILLCVGNVIPMFLGYIFLPSRTYADRLTYEIGWWNATNPFMVFENECRDTSIAVAVAWALFAAVFSIPWFVRQVQQFRPWDEVAAEPIPTVEALGEPPEYPDIVDSDGSNAD